MKNFAIVQINANFRNGWVVKADSKRFGRQQIMFEGSYEECWDYIERMAFFLNRDRVSVWVYGERNGIELQGVTIVRYNDGFEHYPQYEFPNFVLKSDIEKLDRFLGIA